MSSFHIMACLALLLVLLPMATMGDNLSPLLAPYLDNICNGVECGKGTCQSGVQYKFGFMCQCEAGWKRTRLDNETDLQFLPCVIPNCTLNYSCMQTAPPLPPNPYNISAFDPCYWMYCGEGTCTRPSLSRPNQYQYQCQCNAGYSNLLNITAYPCYSECALGSDCARLGIKVSNSISSSPASAISFLPGKFHWTAYWKLNHKCHIKVSGSLELLLAIVIQVRLQIF